MPVMAYCLMCGHATGEGDELYCSLTGLCLGIVHELALSGTPNSCPLPKEERVVEPLPRNKAGHTHIHHKRVAPPDAVQSDVVPTCYGAEYSSKLKCDKCIYSQSCAEHWSVKAWNTHKARGYGRWSRDMPSNSWDDIVRTVEGE